VLHTVHLAQGRLHPADAGGAAHAFNGQRGGDGFGEMGTWRGRHGRLLRNARDADSINLPIMGRSSRGNQMAPSSRKAEICAADQPISCRTASARSTSAGTESMRAEIVL